MVAGCAGGGLAGAYGVADPARRFRMFRAQALLSGQGFKMNTYLRALVGRL